MFSHHQVCIVSCSIYLKIVWCDLVCMFFPARVFGAVQYMAKSPSAEYMSRILLLQSSSQQESSATTLVVLWVYMHGWKHHFNLKNTRRFLVRYLRTLDTKARKNTEKEEDDTSRVLYLVFISYSYHVTSFMLYLVHKKC